MERRKHRNYGWRYRPVYVGLAAALITAEWLVGPYLFHDASIVVLSVTVALLVTAWLVDSIYLSVRRRMALRNRRS